MDLDHTRLIPIERTIVYVDCHSEEGLITTFVDWWQRHTPEVITGWNCELYDIPYLMGRIERIMGEKYAKRMSPWGIV